jgi:hypothetical protein
VAAGRVLHASSSKPSWCNSSRSLSSASTCRGGAILRGGEWASLLPRVAQGKPVEAETFELDEHLKAHASHTHDLGGDTLSVGLFVLVLFSLRNQLSLACYVPLSAHIFHRLGRGAEGCTRLTGRAPNLMPPSLAMRSAIILRRCNLSLPDSSRREGHWCRRWYGRKGSVPLMADDEQGLAECWAALSECGIVGRCGLGWCQ